MTKNGLQAQFLLPLVVQTFLCVSATSQEPPPQAPKSPESCQLEPKKAHETAGRLGYIFSARVTAGSATCVLDKGTILVVSATSSDDAVCDFELFTPPLNKKSPVLRLGIKAGAGSNIEYFQRGTDNKMGLKISLRARKGETLQYRIAVIDVEPVSNQCTDSALYGAL